jgi:hypothetical protein
MHRLPRAVDTRTESGGLWDLGEDLGKRRCRTDFLWTIASRSWRGSTQINTPWYNTD